jgi:hypothetical protein
MNGHQRRLTLLPFGRTWPNDATYSLNVLLVACGGDPSQYIEGSPRSSLEDFMHRASDHVMSRDANQLIVALGKEDMSVSQDILTSRALLEKRFPQLEKAIWIIFVVDPLEVMLVRSLNEMGSYSSPELETVPVWTSNLRRNDPYLVFVPRTSSPSVIPMRIRHMRTNAYKTTGGFRVPSTSAVAALTPEQIAAAAAEADKTSSRS